MSDSVVEFLQENYKLLQVLKETETSRIELVLGLDSYTYIRRILKTCHAPYQALSKLKSNHISRIYYTAEAEGITYVIEEYVKGRTLQELLESKGTFTETEVEVFALQLCEALEKLHQLGILHRDIKPDNIMLQENGQVKLIDFNAARIKSTGKKHDTQIMGTEGYAPPEQYGFSITDERSDWYALGKTLEELLAPDYKGKLSSVISKCTRFDPQDRISSAKEFRELLKDSGYKKILYLGMAALLVIGSWWYWSKPFQYPEAVPEKTESTSHVAQVEKGPSQTEAQSEKQPALTNNANEPTKASENPAPREMVTIPTEKKPPITYPQPTNHYDENTIGSHIKVKSITLVATSKATSYPRELRVPPGNSLGSIQVKQTEGVYDGALVVVRCEDLYMVPDNSPNSPYSEKALWISYNSREKAKFAYIQLKPYFLNGKNWKPNETYQPIWGNDKFKFYQTGRFPRLLVSLSLPDKKPMWVVLPINIVEP